MKKSILITGASSGIGKYSAELLAKRDWIVWAGYRKETDRKRLLQTGLKRIKPIKIDVTDEKTIIKAKEIIIKSKTPLHALFNNAGVALGAPVEALDIQEIKSLYEVNFFGVIRMTKTFLPLLRESSGRIINMSSMSGRICFPFMSPYSSSKYALESLSDGLRREIKGQGVKVAIIQPGIIKTAIWEKSITKSKKAIENSEILDIYQPALDKFLNKSENNDRYAVPIEKLGKAIIDAAENKKPKTRYLVTKNNLVIKIMLKILPDKTKDFLLKLIING